MAKQKLVTVLRESEKLIEVRINGQARLMSPKQARQLYRALGAIMPHLTTNGTDECELGGEHEFDVAPIHVCTRCGERRSF